MGDDACACTQPIVYGKARWPSHSRKTVQTPQEPAPKRGFKTGSYGELQNGPEF
jgi:hypothetical protein